MALVANELWDNSPGVARHDVTKTAIPKVRNDLYIYIYIYIKYNIFHL